MDICRLQRADQPVVGISWYEAVAYCNWRSVRKDLVPATAPTDGSISLHQGYRLPTEVEWEYAAAEGEPG